MQDAERISRDRLDRQILWLLLLSRADHAGLLVVDHGQREGHSERGRGPWGPTERSDQQPVETRKEDYWETYGKVEHLGSTSNGT